LRQQTFCLIVEHGEGHGGGHEQGHAGGLGGGQRERKRKRKRGLGHISERQSVVYKLYPFQIEMRVKMQLTWSLAWVRSGRVVMATVAKLPFYNVYYSCSLFLSLPTFHSFSLAIFFYSLCAHKNRKWL